MNLPKSTYAALVVASLGYFVDIYDLILFSIVRIPSLKALGLTDQELLDSGLLLLNIQMTGMLIGGIIFGVLGDKLGRLKVLFSSILLYSVANLANAFVTSVEQYAILRFLAGLGLAGELGAGVTLVAELLPKGKRGFGTTLIATIGVSGALFAWIIADKFDWRTAYTVGGVMGLALLMLRIGVLESGLFNKAKAHTSASRGDFFMLFKKGRLKRFAACIAIGIPIWYIIGILMTLSPEFAPVLGIEGSVVAGKAVFYCYAGLVIGDLASGLLSQFLKSRKRSILIFISMSLIGTACYFFLRGLSVENFYLLSLFLGFGAGYWAMFVTTSAEQFGTNIRATVTTSVPNFVRGSLVLVSALFAALKTPFGLWNAGITVGTICFAIAIWGFTQLKESFHEELDYLETH